MKRVVVVSGVAGGMSAAARLRRLDERAHHRRPREGRRRLLRQLRSALPRGRRDRAALQAPAAHPPGPSRRLRPRRRRTTTVLGIDREARTVQVRDHSCGYDVRRALRRARPRDRGRADRAPVPRRRPARGAHPAHRPRRRRPARHARRGPRRAPSWSVPASSVSRRSRRSATAASRSSLVELAPQVLPAIDADMAFLVEQELRAHDVDVRTGVGLAAIEDDQRAQGSTSSSPTGRGCRPTSSCSAWAYAVHRAGA